MSRKSKGLIAAEEKIAELETTIEERDTTIADLAVAAIETAEANSESLLHDNWYECACKTCVTIRAHQDDTETIDEILVLATK